jgi:peptide/nickel transport system permease protein
MSETQTPGQEDALVAPRADAPRVEREFTVKERSQASMVLRRFVRHRLAMTSLVVLLAIVLFAFVGPLLWHFTYEDISSAGSSPPTATNPFGTDELGHDLFAQVMRGAQQSLKVALLVALVSMGLGAPYGAVAGYYGGRLDSIMMRICDVLLTLPLIAVAGAIVVGRGGSILVVSLVIGLLNWVIMARVVRGVVLSLREQEFVEAARALGAGTPRIVFRHLLPNVTGPIIVQATLDIAAAILIEAALSFLGIGVQAPDTSLGVLANQARNAVDTRPWLFYFPGLMIILIALTINFIGDGLRDAFDPRQTRQRR